MLFYAIFLALTAPKVLRGGMRGRLYPIYMVAYGVFRGINECFRYSSETQSLFHRAHIWAVISIAVGLAGVACCCGADRRKRTKHKQQKA